MVITSIKLCSFFFERLMIRKKVLFSGEEMRGDEGRW